MSCRIELTTVSVFPEPLTDFVCHTCELPAPDGRCMGTGETIPEDDSRHMATIHLHEEYR